MSIGELEIDGFDDAAAISTERWNQGSIAPDLLTSALSNKIEQVVENGIHASSLQSSRFLSLIDSKATLSHTSWNAKERSLVFETQGKNLLHGKIGGINGIGNLLSEALDHANYLSKVSGDYKVEWVYNCSHSSPVDVAEAIFINYKGISACRKLLRENWIRFHEERFNDPNAKYLQFCHSQGAIPVKLELAALPAEIQKRIIVIALAPAAIIPQSLCFESYNYSSKRDPIPYGEIVTDVFFSPMKTLRDMRDLQALVALDPHPKAPFFDHAMNSLTFEKVIAEHIETFIKNYG